MRFWRQLAVRLILYYCSRGILDLYLSNVATYFVEIRNVLFLSFRFVNVTVIEIIIRASWSPSRIRGDFLNNIGSCCHFLPKIE